MQNVARIVCPTCNGNGEFFTVFKKEPMMCPTCNGHGIVDKVTTVTMVPIEKKPFLKELNGLG